MTWPEAISNIAAAITIVGVVWALAWATVKLLGQGK